MVLRRWVAFRDVIGFIELVAAAVRRTPVLSRMELAFRCGLVVHATRVSTNKYRYKTKAEIRVLLAVRKQWPCCVIVSS